jgi:hypothetical protein
VLESTLIGWPHLHVRLALVDDRTGPNVAGLASRRGPLLYVAAHIPARAAGLGTPSAAGATCRPGRRRQPAGAPRLDRRVGRPARRAVATGGRASGTAAWRRWRDGRVPAAPAVAAAARRAHRQHGWRLRGAGALRRAHWAA